VHRYKLYRNLDELPIYNWDSIQKRNELRYLIILDTYALLPKISKWLQRDLLLIYKDMVGSLDAKSRLLQAKSDVVELLIKLTFNIAENSKDADKIEKASTIIRALMIDPAHPEFLTNVDFTETPDQKSEITFILVAIKKYMQKLDQNKHAKQQNLYEQVAAIESGLGIHIDVHKCSVNQFMAYIKQLKLKVTANG